MLVGGAALAGAYAWGRDDAGYFSTSLRSVQTTTPAVVVSTDLGPVTEPWVAERLGVDIRVRVTPTDPARPLFVGIGPSEAVDAYLSGTAHDRIRTVVSGAATYTRVAGDEQIAPPTEQDFWVAKASGAGATQLSWQPVGGRWTGVLMNSDGTPGVDASVSAAVHAEFLLPLAWTLIGIGLLVTVLAGLLIAYAVRHRRPGAPGAPGTAGPGAVAPAAVGADQTGAMASAGAAPITPAMSPGTPVVMTARLDPALSRAMWLVKWFLAIPHFIVLGFLWAAFGVTTIIAWFAILFTGSYPRGLFDFNVGVLRWTWRVSYYCGTGGLGSDRYPPFSLDPQPEDLATLDVVYPGQLSRGLIFVKWLLAIPHLIITGLLMGSGWRWSNDAWNRDWDTNWGGFGVLGLLVGVAALILLFSGEYPKGLFDLVIGLNRWVYRVGAYVGLMTDEYPPFRLDSGETEHPAPPAPVGAPYAPPGLPPRTSAAAPPTAAPQEAPSPTPPVAAPPEGPPPHGSPAPGMPPPDPREP
jgi:hypothetical protein